MIIIRPHASHLPDDEVGTVDAPFSCVGDGGAFALAGTEPRYIRLRIRLLTGDMAINQDEKIGPGTK